ncbi:MAG TPA: hypothetical protein VIM41_08550 [Gammaproteobacteria bacterium]
MSDDMDTKTDAKDSAATKSGFVTSYLSHFVSYINSTARIKSRYVDQDIQTTEFATITDFWKAARRWNPKMPPEQYIAIRGAISTFAPVLPGDPWGKRDIHRYIRRNYDKIQKSIQESGRSESPTTLDAFLAFSAGQMVIRLSPDEMPYVFLGLYHSIVRNAIPLFVETTYYHKVIEHAMLHNTSSQDVIEAAIIGRLLPMPENFVMQFLHDISLYDYFKDAPVDGLMPRFALQIDGAGDSDPTMVQPISRARYLDGDIWVAIIDGKDERVVSHFLDLANPNDISTERGALKTEVAHYFGACEVLSEYDDTDRIFTEHHILDPTVLWGREKNGTQNKSLPVAERTTIYNIQAKEFNMSQDTINVSNVGGIVNVKSTLKNATLKIEGATAVGEAQRSELQNLFKQLEEALARAEKTKPEDAARVAQTADLVASEVAKAKPDRSFLEITTKGLTEAAKALESIAPSIVNVVASIAKLVLL